MRIDENGIHLRQSDVDGYRKCPEQFRQKFFGEIEDPETDAALVGTAIHALIEHEGTNGHFGTVAEMADFACNYYCEEVDRFEREGIQFNQVKYPRLDRALDMVTHHAANWGGSDFRFEFLRLAANDELLLEWEFDVPLFTHTYNNPDHGTVPVWLCGTSDVVHKGVKVFDWKTAGNMQQYLPWERQRWAIQPTVYTYAAWHAGLIPDPSWVFEYKVFFSGDKPGEASPRTIGVTRGHNHVAWLKQLVAQMLEQAVSDVSPWPQRDDSALCSDKWCPVFAAGRCKGADISSWD